MTGPVSRTADGHPDLSGIWAPERFRAGVVRYSISHWGGDTLVIETKGFRDDVWLDVGGSPLTSTGEISGRFKRVDFGCLNIDIAIEDPKAYTKPFTATVKGDHAEHGFDRIHLR